MRNVFIDIDLEKEFQQNGYVRLPFLNQTQVEELKNSNTLEVPDPYYGGAKGFENVYTMLDNACKIIANRLLKS